MLKAMTAERKKPKTTAAKMSFADGIFWLLAGATPAPDVRMIPYPAGLAKKESNV